MCIYIYVLFMKIYKYIYINTHAHAYTFRHVRTSVTNPLEVLKITAQTNKGPSKSTWQLIREIGPAGLFNGWQATLLRDIPFSGIYFPCYIQAKTGMY